jgi:hypothetical protein
MPFKFPRLIEIFRSGFKTSERVQEPRKIWFTGLPVEPIQKGTKSFFIFFNPAKAGATDQRAKPLST